MSSEHLAPFRLKPWFSPRPWGRKSLEPWYTPAQVGTTEPVGESWLTGPQCVVETEPLAGASFAGQTLAAVASAHAAELLGAAHESNLASAQPAEFPLLVKLLFPADKLSVQVHPDDAHAQAMGQPRGKTECWYVLQADPGAQIALGLQPGVTPDAVRAAIAAGTMEDLMQWLPVTPGEMVFVDAGTIHAIGPGMVLLETQQTSDITFRMYDYGRPRELHVEQALRVMKTHTEAGKVAPIKMQGAPPTRSLGGKETGPDFIRLIQQRYFTVDRYDLAPNTSITIPATTPGCLVTLSGSGTVTSSPDSASAVDLIPGHAIVVPANTGSLTVASAAGTAFVHCWAPKQYLPSS